MIKGVWFLVGGMWEAESASFGPCGCGCVCSFVSIVVLVLAVCVVAGFYAWSVHDVSDIRGEDG